MNEIYSDSIYYFQVVPFNGSDSVVNYQKDANEIFEILTPLNEIKQGYYQSISITNLLDDLRNLLEQHTMVDYADYATLMMDKFYSKLIGPDSHLVFCQYSQDSIIYEGDFDFSISPFSREHIFCQSWMNDKSLNYQLAISDYHNIIPVLQDQVNAVRNNNPFGEVIVVLEKYKSGKLGYDLNGKLVYEPVDKIKGDVARAIFYQTIAYSGLDSIHFPFFQDEVLLRNGIIWIYLIDLNEHAMITLIQYKEIEIHL